MKIIEKVLAFKAKFGISLLFFLPLLKLHYYLMKRVGREQCIFRRKKTGSASFSNFQLEVEKYTKADDVPKSIKSAMDKQANTFASGIAAEEFDNHGIFWIGFIEGQPAVTQWTRYGRYIYRWYMHIEEDDLLLFRAFTFPRWRGHGLWPHLKHYIIQQELPNEAFAYVDCKIWNISSKRAIKKAGFKHIRTMYPKLQKIR